MAMVEINAALVKQLRDKTGAGIADCKKALQENEGDLKKSEEWLRAKGVKVEKLGRATAEGTLVVRTSADAKKAVVIELKCETDFSARNAGFVALAGKIADVVMAKGAKDVASALKLPIDGAANVEAAIQQEITMGCRENVKFDWMDARQLDSAGKIGSYVHMNNKLAVLVAVTAPNDAATKKPEFEALVKDLAMHVAGRVPAAMAVDRAGMPKDLVDAEKTIILKQIDEDPKNAKKPPQIKEKMIDGKLGAFFKERVLLEQQYVKDENLTVDQLLEQVGKAIGGKPQIAWFVRRTLGGQ
jgi:elongation factor Ts